ncbi:MAG: glycerophosphoryl diester phosphodiesterase [Phenylobacterium sp.]|jgi:glycerophosphoryl diester phosphodiesterase
MLKRLNLPDKCLLTALLVALLALQGCASVTKSEHKLVIAHRGASGYLPEHSLPAKAMAYAMGVDYIEQDVVMTKDNHLVVLHDRYLDRVTDVMQRFPKRYRLVAGDKRWFAIDFTLDEIKQLKMSEGFSLDKNSKLLTAGYPNRFPLFKSNFSVSTLAEEIELIQGLNHSTGKSIGKGVGLYVEIKAPWFHRHEGKDISKAVLTELKGYGYTSKADKVFVQCFDPVETKRIHDQLMPALGVELKLVQLIAQTDWLETFTYQQGTATPYNYDWMFEAGAMTRIAKYADAIGPWKSMLISDDSTPGHLIISNMVTQAHAAGLKVHPYTFRNDPGRIPGYATSFEDMLDIFLYQVGVDGIFSDYPDLAVDFVRRSEAR